MIARFACVSGLLLSLGAGCGGSTPATATERLWVSNLPTGPRVSFTAFVSVRATDDRYYGTFFHGSLFRGGHDAFRWDPRDKDQARVTFLQDSSERSLRFASCEPSTGFDLCVQVRGGPYGVERYQSRKRWVVGRKGGAPAALEVGDVLAELAQDDADLSAAMAD